MEKTPLVSNVVGFLRDFAPEELARLQAKFPGSAEQAFLREEMGTMAPLLRAQIVTTVAALNEFLSRWNQRSPLAKAQLGRADRWTFAGAVLATLGSGSALSLLLGGSDTPAVPISAGLGLIGGLIGVTDRFLRRDLYGADNSLVERLRELSLGAAKASTYIRQLSPYIETGDEGGDPAALSELLKAADDHVGQMHVILDALPA